VWQAAAMLIVISGLPATGKSTLAAELARRLNAVHLSVDTIEDALLRSGLEPGWTTGVAAYEAVGSAAQQNLSQGLRVVVDAVNDSEAARQVWRRAAERAGVAVRFVLLEPPDSSEHQRRLLVRQRGLEHVPEPSWSQVERRADAYEAWRKMRIRTITTAAVTAALVSTLGAPAIAQAERMQLHCDHGTLAGHTLERSNGYAWWDVADGTVYTTRSLVIEHDGEVVHQKELGRNSGPVETCEGEHHGATWSVQLARAGAH
jgi:predicted kinase